MGVGVGGLREAGEGAGSAGRAGEKGRACARLAELKAAHAVAGRVEWRRPEADAEQPGHDEQHDAGHARLGRQAHLRARINKHSLDSYDVHNTQKEVGRTHTRNAN